MPVSTADSALVVIVSPALAAGTLLHPANVVVVLSVHVTSWFFNQKVMGVNGWVVLFVTLSVGAFAAAAAVRAVEMLGTELTGFSVVTAAPMTEAGVPAHPVNVFAVLPVHVTSIPRMRSTGGRK